MGRLLDYTWVDWRSEKSITARILFADNSRRCTSLLLTHNFRQQKQGFCSVELRCLFFFFSVCLTSRLYWRVHDSTRIEKSLCNNMDSTAISAAVQPVLFLMKYLLWFRCLNKRHRETLWCRSEILRGWMWLWLYIRPHPSISDDLNACHKKKPYGILSLSSFLTVRENFPH